MQDRHHLFEADLSPVSENGASTRLAAISTPRRTAPAKKAATVIATARARIDRKSTV